MQITTVTFSRKGNTGDYTSFDVSATATIAPGEDATAAGKVLQGYVDQLCQERIEGMRRPGARGGKDVGEWSDS